MKISKYLYFIEKENKYYIVQLVNKKFMEVTKDIYNIIKYKKINKIVNNHILKDMKNMGIIIDDHIDEIEILKRDYYNMIEDNGFKSLHIIPTSNCNLGCEYCFVLKDMDNKRCHKNMDMDLLLNGLKLFFDNNPIENLTVTFYGGEPLLKPDVLYMAVDYINKQNKNIHKKIITNATLVTPEIARFLYENDFDINVSIDGNKKAHDKFRVYKDKRSSYQDTLKGYKNLVDAGNRVKVLMTVGDFNFNDLEECVKNVLELQPISIGLNLPKKLQNENNEIEENLNFHILLDKYFKCVDMCYEYHIPESHYCDIMYSFLGNDFHYKPCHACGNQIVLSPFGNIGPCQAYISNGKYYTDIKEFNNLNDVKENEHFKKWNSINIDNREKCKECYLMPICPGDCPYDWENRDGDFNSPTESYCLTRKAMFDYFANRIISGKKVLFD